MEKEAQQTQQTTLNYIDGYCERASKPDVMAEPINLVTNIAFVIGALLVVKTLLFYKQFVKANFDIIFLTIVLAGIGFGSAAFHSYPSGTTVLMDVIPIAIFINVYLVCFFKRVVGLNLFLCLMVLVAFTFVGIYFENNFSR
jgi:hypothetical protein